MSSFRITATLTMAALGLCGAALGAEEAWVRDYGSFLIRGEIRNYRWHVIAAPNPDFGGHGGNAPMAEQFEAGGERMAAEVVGFYSGDKLAGVISHSGEKFHEHLLDPGRTVTGHLDAYDVGTGAVLSLPASVPAASSGLK